MTQRHPIQNEAIMLITTNIAWREPLFSNPAYAREAVEALYRTQELYPFLLYGFVIMPNHVHLLLDVPMPGNISSVIRAYKRAVSHAIGLGPIWQPRFDLRIVKSAHHSPQLYS